jgi:Ca2+-binding EF-hand superfamily protein
MTTEWFGNQDPYVELSLGAFWKHKTEVKSNAGTNALWETEISHEIMASHLQRSNFEFVVKEQNTTRKDAYLGRGSISGMPLLQKPNEWISLTGDLKPSGKFFIDARYMTHAVAVASGKSSKSAKHMEDALKKQLQDELDKERRKMAEMMAEQNRMLQESLKGLQSQATAPSDKPWHGMSVTELKKVVLPSNVFDWRAAHVQAWLAFKMDLPQHVQQFQNASIDGFLLLKHIDERVLRDRLQVGDELDVAKIMGGIQRLKARQTSLDRAAAVKEAEAEAAAEEIVEKVKANKKKKGREPITFFGDVKEQNDLERVRLERMMRQKRAEETKAKKKLATRSDVWKFEYTGGVKPVSADEELYGAVRTKHTGNTAAFERAMAGLFRDNAMTTDISVPSYTGGTRQVPRDAVVDEVVAVTKAAMFELSNRLLEIEKRRAVNEKDADSDIDVDDFGEDVDDVAIDGLDDEPPPPEEESQVSANQQDARDVDSDEEELGPPPEYEDPNDKKKELNKLASIPPITFDTTVKTIEIDEGSQRFNRSLLVFNALVNRQNNDASFLGKNDKLTRMKFHGGIEAVLKLKMSWPQFDALWTKLDYRRSGELDHEEFGHFFGDFSEYDYQKTKRSGSIDTLADIMYELCNAVRREGFNVVEIFSSFDRNGSGEVSVSEFCSMVRAVLGRHVDKKKIFRAFSLMDVDANRCISCQEVLTLVYNVWKSQMKELAAKLSVLDDEIDGPVIKKIMDERNQIKDAVKKNFPREWRDRLERTKDQYSKGAFSHLLKTMNVSTTTSHGVNSSNFHDTFALSGPQTMHSTIPLQTKSSAIHSSLQPSPPKKKISGKNEMLRYKVNKARTHVPTRGGVALTTPHVTSFGQTDITSEGAALRKLQQTEPSGGKVFVMTSNL